MTISFNKLRILPSIPLALFLILVSTTSYAQDEQSPEEEADRVIDILDDVEDQRRGQSTDRNKTPPRAGQGKDQLVAPPLSEAERRNSIVHRGARSAQATQEAWDYPDQPAPGQYQAGVMLYSYEPFRTETIILRAGTSMRLMLPNWEIVDADGIDVGAKGVLKAQLIGSNELRLSVVNYIDADTNLIVTGRRIHDDPASQIPTRNIYLFYVRVVGPDYPQKTDLVGRVLAPYPFEDTSPVQASGNVSLADVLEKRKFKRVQTRPDLPEYLAGAPINLSDLSFNDYRMFIQDDADREIAPRRVFHDGRFTYLDFGVDRVAKIQMPVASQVINGVESPVATRFDGPGGSLMIIETVGDLSLRHGNRLVCLRCISGGACTAPSDSAAIHYLGGQ